jgi:hypothetical protein
MELTTHLRGQSPAPIVKKLIFPSSEAKMSFLPYGMEDRRECSDRKIVSRCRERARRVYYGAVFEIKKEIPAYDQCHHCG